MSPLAIRAREPADSADLTALFNCPGVIAGTLQLPLRSEALRREQATTTTPDDHHLVAVLDGTVIGALGLHVERTPRRRHCASIGMAVHDNYQSRGAGRALLAAALDLADNWLGLGRLELTVFTDNAPAVHLYDAHGFVIEGTHRGYAFRNGGLTDAYSMARLAPRLGHDQ